MKVSFKKIASLFELLSWLHCTHRVIVGKTNQNVKVAWHLSLLLLETCS